MGFGDEDQILIANLYVVKVLEQIKEFPNKCWGLWELNKLLKSCKKNWYDCKMKRHPSIQQSADGTRWHYITQICVNEKGIPVC